MQIKIIMLGGKSGIGKSYAVNLIKKYIPKAFLLSFANPMKYLLLNYHNIYLSKDCVNDIWLQNVLFPIFNSNIMHIIKNEKYNLLNKDNFVSVNLLLFSQINNYFYFYDFEKLKQLLYFVLEKEFYNFSSFKLNDDENIRKFLQYWGTDIIRNKISENAWVYLYLIRINRMITRIKNENYLKIYILTDDVRFNNEITEILTNPLIDINEVHFIYLYNSDLKENYIHKHISEKSLNIQELLNTINDNRLFIYVLKNNFKIDDIIKAIVKTNVL